MLSETALIKEVKKKNRQALEELHNRFAPVLLGLCLRYCGNRADAEDVLHDSFIKILSNIDNFLEKSGSSFEGWMKRIAINTSLNFLRNRSKTNNWVELDPIQEQISVEDEEELSLAGFAGSLEKEDILQMICELPYGYRTVFNMYVFEDYSHKEIAEALNCNESTSKTQLFKARAILKKRILEVLNDKVLNK
ncbi:MAG: RNA polymerase sigma factor [Bacteroidetes bacterium]|nr:RNA polymerase sigma factor [Bacteroidota bacterium]